MNLLLFRRLLFSTLVATVTLIVASIAVPPTFAFATPQARVDVTIPDGPLDKWDHLNQNWDWTLRKLYYTTSQGSELMPYDWFMALEQAGSQEPFARNLQRYGFLPGPSEGSDNPSVLPLGFVQDETTYTLNGLSIKKWIGLTCAACHTGALTYHASADTAPVKIVIDGGQNNGDYGAFVKDLRLAIQETAQNAETFDRFAKSVLGWRYNFIEVRRLKDQYKKYTAYFERLALCFESPIEWGPGRVDAFGAILNNATYQTIGIPANRRPANAPVSFPFLWNIDKQDHIQWFGEVGNAQFMEQLARNSGEVLGVFLRIDIDPGALRYKSSLKPTNLIKLEHWLHLLNSPKWPEDKLGKIDVAKRDRGAILYKKYCSTATCHPALRADNKQVHIAPIPLSQVKTDPATTTNIHTRVVATGRLQGLRELPLQQRFGPTSDGPTVLGHEVMWALVPDLGMNWLNDLAKINQDVVIDNLHPKEGVNTTVKPQTPGYEARPLNGIWATAPYLHNGSVPNLYQLLLPSDQRMKTFNRGTYEFDPVNVGYQTDPSYGGKTFDTSIPGNLNIGHDYWPSKLTDDDRWDLIEYLKSL